MAKYTAEERRRMRALKRLSSARDSEFEGFVTHSTLYHRVFEGYSERQVPRENGKGTRIERVYVGMYYIRQCGGKSTVPAKLLYAFLYLLASGSFLFALSRPIGYNSVWYGVIPAFAEIIALLFLAANLFTCLGAPCRMTLYYYNSFGKMMSLSLLAAGIVLVYTLLCAVFVFLNGTVEGSLPVLIPGALAAAALLALFQIERHTCYETIENDKELSSDAVVIS
ncbi:MAG: hypothetical protein ACI4O5_01310 [Oscillospiraceae bacterium]